jgi:NADP-dependent 3-hydroxy acid dehydrogenase YdfG
MPSKTWLITGASRGFGYLWAKAALDRGDRVAATARNLDDLNELHSFGDRFLPLQLNVCDPNYTVEAIFKVVDSTTPPPRLLLGIAALQTVETMYAKRHENWRTWSEVTTKAHGPHWHVKHIS